MLNSIIPPLAHRSKTAPAAYSGGNGADFVDRLEALRGVAAMMVAMSHSLLVLPAVGWQSPVIDGLTVLFNGKAAVALFFVLSGLVLGFSLRRDKTNFIAGFAQYSFRRVLRIWPAFIFSTLVIAGYLWFIYKDRTFPTAAPWFEQAFGSYHDPLTIRELMRNLLLSTSAMNNVTWTLRIEVICSLLLPFVHWLLSKGSDRRALLLLAFFVVLYFDPNRNSTAYMFMFTAGYLIPTIGPQVFSRLQKKGNAIRWLIIGAVPLFLYPQFPPWVKTPGWWTVKTGFLMEGMGAAIIISGLLYGTQLRFYRLLDHPVVKFYGKISYSFYLWHCFCLYLVSRWVLDSAPLLTLRTCPLLWAFLMWVISTCAATGISYLSYRCIEKPFIHLSKVIVKQARVLRPSFFKERQPSLD